MGVVRPPAVTGSFYPRSADELSRAIDRLLVEAELPVVDLDPAMLIVPHAGYVYSGPVAATGYRLLAEEAPPPRRIVALGPSHHEAFTGVAAPDADAWQTPLGLVGSDATVPAGVSRNAAAHAREHSLEVQLPFLQTVLDGFTVLGLLTGDGTPEETAAVLDEALTRVGGFGIISSDLSHYQDYEKARRRDDRTARAIVSLEPEAIAWGDACGATAIKAALLVARARGWQCRLLDLRNSGDTAGDHARVVGYGAFVLGPAVTR